MFEIDHGITSVLETVFVYPTQLFSWHNWSSQGLLMHAIGSSWFQEMLTETATRGYFILVN